VPSMAVFCNSLVSCLPDMLLEYSLNDFEIVLLLNQRRFPPPRLQVSNCRTYLITCDVSTIAVFSSESIECFLGMASKFVFKPFVTIPVALIITGITIHFKIHIRCISIH